MEEEEEAEEDSNMILPDDFDLGQGGFCETE